MTSEKSLVLYHFAPSHAMRGIKATGLTKGALPWNRAKDGTPQLLRNMKGPRFEGPGFQWLTTSQSWEQPFALLGALPISKNCYRITVLIPHKAQRFVLSWPELCRRCRPDCAEELNTPAVDWQNWRVFYGPIPTAWFLAIERNPHQPMRAAEELYT